MINLILYVPFLICQSTSTQVSIVITTRNHHYCSNYFSNNDTDPIIDTSTQGVNTRPFQTIVSLILRKLCMALCLIVIGTLGLTSLIFGVIGHHRQCNYVKLPSLPVWLIVLGSTTLFLVIVLIALVSLVIISVNQSMDLAFAVDRSDDPI